MQIAAIHDVDPTSDHYRMVKADMERLGVPTIDVRDDDGIYSALEGSHRLAICAELGIVPSINVIGYYDMVKWTDYDADHFERDAYDVERYWDGTYGKEAPEFGFATAGALSIGCGPVYTFGED